MFKVGDLVQSTESAQIQTRLRRRIGIVLGVHPTGALRVRFNELSCADKARELWASPELLVRASE